MSRTIQPQIKCKQEFIFRLDWHEKTKGGTVVSLIILQPVSNNA